MHALYRNFANLPCILNLVKLICNHRLLYLERVTFLVVYSHDALGSSGPPKITHIEPNSRTVKVAFGLVWHCIYSTPKLNDLSVFTSARSSVYLKCHSGMRPRCPLLTPHAFWAGDLGGPIKNMAWIPPSC